MTAVSGQMNLQCSGEWEGGKYDVWKSPIGLVVPYKQMEAMFSLFERSVKITQEQSRSHLDGWSESINQFTDTTNYIHRSYKATINTLSRDITILKVALVIMSIVAVALGIALLVVIL
jgi:hypothetical protein